ncbi:MAG: GMC family oxidoreductase [Candidatus Omnitrophica bacterium]|nr:GMC family oxidoreductase [Candidatus Omnitrophota bacterium]
MGHKHVNAVIIGAGAGGGVTAKVVCEAGLSVVLLEAGPWYSASDFQKDELQNTRRAYLGNAYAPDPAKNPRVLVNAEGRQNIGGHGYVAECVGGGTQSYGALAYRYLPQDFRMKSTYGAVEGSTLEDWPISYEDLEPYYEKAEWEIGVSGDYSGNPFHPPSNRSLPMPPLPPNRAWEILKPAAQQLGWHPFDTPMLRNSIPYEGRAACMRCRWCVGFICEVDAKNGTQNTVIPKALKTGLCELRTGCRVREIQMASATKARGVIYHGPDGRLQTQTADLVIVSTSAVEAARLLLNSRSTAFPEGLGNRYDCVGRNLQSHAYAGAEAIFPEEVQDDLGPGASIAVCDFNHGNPGLIGGGVIANDFIKLPIQFTNILPPGTPRWGKAHKDHMRQNYRRFLGVKSPIQEMPMWDMRVELDPVVRDYWGVPVPRISGVRHPQDVQLGRFMADRCEEWLREAGASQVWKGSVSRKEASLGQHQSGTCRMGTDPTTSVVDPQGRVHDVDNVHVISGAVHVTNGGFNPVLTILALAYRSAEKLCENWRSGKWS